MSTLARVFAPSAAQPLGAGLSRRTDLIEDYLTVVTDYGVAVTTEVPVNELGAARRAVMAIGAGLPGAAAFDETTQTLRLFVAGAPVLVTPVRAGEPVVLATC